MNDRLTPTRAVGGGRPPWCRVLRLTECAAGQSWHSASHRVLPALMRFQNGYPLPGQIPARPRNGGVGLYWGAKARPLRAAKGRVSLG